MISEDILQRARNSFRQSIYEVMEKMYFIFLEPVSDGLDEEHMHEAEVDFSGLWAGKITVLFSSELLKLMISNVLGLDDEEIGEKITEDTAKECVNMVAGSFLRKFEPDKALHLSIPSYHGVKYFKKPDGQIIFTMEADRGRMYAILNIKEGQ